MGFQIPYSRIEDLIEGVVDAAHLITDAAIAALDGKVDTVDGKVVIVDGKVDTVDTVVDAVKAKTDNLPTDPADQSDLEDILERKYPFLDFWSAPEDKITVAGAAANLDFPNVVVSGFPATATIKRVVVILTIRALLDTSAADNYIDQAAKTLRVKKSTANWATGSLVGITFAQNSLYCVASAKEAGPVIIGSHDVKGTPGVDGDATYNFRSEETSHGEAISALANDLELYDVQVGLRVFYE